MNINPTLKSLLANDFPPAFVLRILQTLPKVYQEAHDSVTNDPRFGEPEANYMLGHTRRALFETEFRNIAIECGINVEMHTPVKGGCSHVRVLFGRFQLIECHVPSPGAFPHHSDCREQYSAVNEHIQQIQMFARASNPHENSLYGILTHTSDARDVAKFRSAQIGFPDPAFESWVEEPIDLLDIRDRQAQVLRATEDLQAAVQDPKPKWKLQAQTNPKTAKKQSKSGEDK